LFREIAAFRQRHLAVTHAGEFFAAVPVLRAGEIPPRIGQLRGGDGQQQLLLQRAAAWRCSTQAASSSRSAGFNRGTASANCLMSWTRSSALSCVSSAWMSFTALAMSPAAIAQLSVARRSRRPLPRATAR